MHTDSYATSGANRAPSARSCANSCVRTVGHCVATSAYTSRVRTSTASAVAVVSPPRQFLQLTLIAPRIPILADLDPHTRHDIEDLPAPRVHPPTATEGFKEHK